MSYIYNYPCKAQKPLKIENRAILEGKYMMYEIKHEKINNVYICFEGFGLDRKYRVGYGYFYDPDESMIHAYKYKEYGDEKAAQNRYRYLRNRAKQGLL